MRRFVFTMLFASLAAFGQSQPQARILDLKHYSHVLGEERHFRVFLPPDYDESAKRYPVIYFFHGWSERYNQPPRGGSGYDSGDDYGGDNIAAFVGRHDVIVVKWDGYNPRSPGEAYPRPYNVSPVETYRQFPLYFPELVRHIDVSFRTLPDRDHRATAGLSMGGFMSFWTAGKYPHLVGSASNFMGSSEFDAGPNGFPSEYRHDEMFRNYEGIRTRIVLGSRDFIRWYHRRMNAIWDYTRPFHEHEEFDSEHGTPAMAKTLDFHLAAFENPLPKPTLWHHADVYPTFEAWGYSVTTDRRQPGFTLLENVSHSGFRSTVREWLPGGRSLPRVTVRLTTDRIYDPGRTYFITTVIPGTGEIRQSRKKADSKGRLNFLLNGAPHEIGILAEKAPLLAVSSWRVVGAPWVTAGQPARLAIELLNKGSADAQATEALVSSPNPKVKINQGRLSVGHLAPGEGKTSETLPIVLVEDPAQEILKLEVHLGEMLIPIEIPVFRDVPELSGFEVLDGGDQLIWQQAVEKSSKTLGSGNADGVANPGETVAIGILESGAIRAVELFSSDPCVDLSLRHSDPWGDYDHVGGTAKISFALISSSCAAGHEIPFFVRYQIPNKPDHILKEGAVRVRVQGADRTPPHVRSAAVDRWNRLEVEIRDGATVQSALATLRSGDAILRVPLNDQGLSGDIASDDGWFTGLLPNPAKGLYQLSVSAEDEFGNAIETAPASGAEIRISR